MCSSGLQDQTALRLIRCYMHFKTLLQSTVIKPYILFAVLVFVGYVKKAETTKVSW